MSTLIKSSGSAHAGDRWEKYRSVVGGLSEYWYPVTTVAELRKKKRMTLTLLGKHLVLFYEQERAFALLDECPHRQVPLSLGKIEFPGHVSCIYHGWTFNLKTGRMVAALTDGPQSPINGIPGVRTFPVEERIGLIFVWTGEGQPVPPESDIPTELLQRDARVYPFAQVVKGNWRHAVENGFDEAHAKMLHRDSLWLLFRNISAWNETDVKKSEDGTWLVRHQKAVHLSSNYPELGTWPKPKFWVPPPKQGGAPGVTGGNDHVISVRLPGTLRVRQPGTADWTHYEWYVPADANHYRYLVLAVTWRKSPWSRLMFWLRYWSYILLIHHRHFNGQDLNVVASMPESTPAALFRPDISIIEWRRLVQECARPVNPGLGAQTVSSPQSVSGADPTSTDFVVGAQTYARAP
jgi:phenylpropionate dioxygenase-like ring-hydroxylating dioxygenase large terminal subunit